MLAEASSVNSINDVGWEGFLQLKIVNISHIRFVFHVFLEDIAFIFKIFKSLYGGSPGFFNTRGFDIFEIRYFPNNTF